MQFSTYRAWQRRVGRVENQVVLEGKLNVSLDLATGALLDQPSHLERFQGTFDVGNPAHLGQNGAPEHLPNHGCAQQRRTRVEWERVDAGRQDGVNRGRKLVLDSVVLD